MRKNQDTMFFEYIKHRRGRKAWQKVVSALICVVVFCTTYALILPAITQERETFCGFEAHTHEDACYAFGETTALTELVCQLAEGESHAHTEECYLPAHSHGEDCWLPVHSHTEECYAASEPVLTCGLEAVAAHAHDESCYAAQIPLICELAESEGHAHGESCYSAKVSTLTCTEEETETHTHGDACYTVTGGELICTMAESAGHTHGEGCYGEAQTVKICTLEETEGHDHTDACYAPGEPVLTCTLGERTTPELNCGLEERAEPTLACGLEETEGHVHGEGCFETVDAVLICDQEETEEHTHEKACYGEPEPVLICELEEHTHELICYSDKTADVETAAEWEATFAGAELSGVWAEDLLTIAATQIGYQESTANYIVLEDGKTIHGYTRYGHWYGDHYGDWCAMFVSFCLHYADVEEMPLDANCQSWINALTEAGLYTKAAEPAPGDLVFFDYEKDGISDHIGIVETVTDTEITTIEGNSANRVQRVTYARDNTAICGYGSLPYQLSDAEQAEVDHVISLIDAMPSADEIDAKLAEFEEAEDYEGEEVWYVEVSQQVAEAYYYYEKLSENLKPYVTNEEKLLELEYIWSVTEFIYYTKMDSDPVTTVQSASTSEFVELNLYDYYGAKSAGAAGKTDINYRWENVSYEFPGFQWNAGAYPYKYYWHGSMPWGWIADRNLVDCIDFGNSLITDYKITETLYVPNYSTYFDSTYDGFKGDKSGSARLTATSGTSKGNINRLVVGNNVGTTDRPIGITAYGAVVSNMLGDDGYPHLTQSASALNNYSASLSYLFDETHAGRFADKKNTQSIDGLFQQDPVSGEYFYNSRWNHAQYSSSTSKFTLYNQTITPNFILYPFGNFLPFNDITDENDTTQVEAFNYSGGVKDYIQSILNNLEATSAYKNSTDLSVVRLVHMLYSYRFNWETYYDPNNKTGQKYWSTITAADALNDFFNNATEPSTAQLDWSTQPELVALLKELYNIDYDIEKNFFFGMEMKMTFMQPKDGLTGSDNGNNSTGSWVWARDKNGDTLSADDDTKKLTGTPDGISDYPMQFFFTGDDDVWVYIDGVRFLDLSGIHRHVGGMIDFQEGMVYYYQLDPATDGDVKDSAYAWQSFKDILTMYGGVAEANLGNYLKKDASGNYTTFLDYSTHTFNFYYMERGSGSSVCRINFNFPLLKKNSISVTKENTAINNTGNEEVMGNPDYYFNIVNGNNELFVGPNSATGIDTYKVMDSAGNILKNSDGTDKEFTVDQYGIFTIKAGQTAVFEGIEENEGKFFVQELIKEEDNGQYPTVKINDAVTRYNALIDWSHRTYFSDSDSDVYTGPYGYKWYGRSGYDTDSSANTSFYFEQQNHVDVSTLGELSITKVLEGEDSDQTFNMEVILDGVKLPVGTRYTLDGVETTVATEGIVPLKPGQTAVIPNIISGTKFTVAETNGGSYTVSYAAENADEMVNNGSSITGVVRTGTTVAVTVTNTEQGTSVTIPVTKRFSADGPTDASHSYSFALQQVTDSTGAVPVENGTTLTENAEFAGNSYSFDFALNYYKHKLGNLPQKFYYKITETAAGTDSLANTQSFVAEVNVVEGGDGGIQATLEKVYGSENNSADFVNTLTGDLTLEKLVAGRTEAQSQGFSFTITLSPGTSGVDPLPTSYSAEFYQQDGTVQPVTLNFGDDYQTTLTAFKHNEKVVIYGLPIGTAWTITEADAEGFAVNTTINGTESGTDAETSGSITTGNTQVAYTNVQTYVLPETGGAGTTTYTLAGLGLMMGAGCLMYNQRKRRKGGKFA